MTPIRDPFPALLHDYRSPRAEALARSLIVATVEWLETRPPGSRESLSFSITGEWRPVNGPARDLLHFLEARATDLGWIDPPPEIFRTALRHGAYAWVIGMDRYVAEQRERMS